MNYRKPLALAVLVLGLALPALAQAKASLPEFADLAANAGQAVVNISAVKTAPATNPLQEFLKNQPNSPFREFFDQFLGNMPNQPRKMNSLGSGFVISADGYVATNNHVVAEADQVTVKLQENGKEYPAKIIGRDPETDLALLKIEAGHSLPVLSFGDSEAVRVGEWVMAIGNPFGLGHTVTAGIVSAKGRIIGQGPFDNFIQTDASINPGNSGGPLIDLDGRVIGINSAIIASGQGIGFAIPSNMAAKILEQLKSGKAPKRGWLGVTIQGVDENTAKALGLPEAKGALVSATSPGDPADKAGIRAGDVILKVDNTVVDDSATLLRLIAGLQPGAKVTLTIWRQGKETTRKVVLEERGASIAALERQERGATPPAKEQTAEEIGVAVRQISPQEARALGLDKPVGLVVTGVQEGSPAAQSDVRPGDVVLEANQNPVNNVAEFQKIVREDGKKRGVVMLLLKRQGRNIFRTIPLD
jgi:serine protease Do